MILSVFLPLFIDIKSFSYNPATEVFVYDKGTYTVVCRGARDFYYDAAIGVRVTADRCDADAIFTNGFES